MNLSSNESEWLAKVAEDIQQFPGTSIVMAGKEQPSWVHHLVHLINGKLGNGGSTVFHITPPEANPVI